LLEVDLFDAHFGKLAWAEETGDDWDIKIADEVITKVVDDIINKASVYQIDRVLLPFGNDFFNVDNNYNTTNKGTPQSEDTRWKKTFVNGFNIAVNIIDKLALIAPVDVLIVPGNHDYERSFYLGHALEAYYSANKNIGVDNSASVRKYYSYGNTLIGFTHGKDEKIDRLPMIMANEKSKDFAATLYHEWHLGDKHHKKDIKFLGSEEVDGVVIRFLRAITPADEWHYKKGYLSKRAAEAFIWHKQTGYICHFSSNIN